MTDIDWNTFNALKTRMKTKFPILLEGYLRDAKVYLTRIEQGLPTGNLPDIIEASHSLKSASGLLGLQNIHNQAKIIEYSAKDMHDREAFNTESLTLDCANLISAFDAISNTLEQELRGVK